MKGLFVIVAVLFIAFPLGAQHYVLQWSKTFDNGGNDEPYAISVDANGIYVIGKLSSGCLVLWYDASGNLIKKVVTYDSNVRILVKTHGIYRIANDNSGNYYYVAASALNGLNSDFLTIKKDASSDNVIWKRTIDKGGNDVANAVTVDADGNVYVTGFSDNGSSVDFLTEKYNSYGKMLWSDRYGDGNEDLAYDIAVDSSGNIYVTGKSDNGSNSDFLTVKYKKVR